MKLLIQLTVLPLESGSELNRKQRPFPLPPPPVSDFLDSFSSLSLYTGALPRDAWKHPLLLLHISLPALGQNMPILRALETVLVFLPACRIGLLSLSVAASAMRSLLQEGCFRPSARGQGGRPSALRPALQLQPLLILCPSSLDTSSFATPGHQGW